MPGLLLTPRMERYARLSKPVPPGSHGPGGSTPETGNWQTVSSFSVASLVRRVRKGLLPAQVGKTKSGEHRSRQRE